MSTPKNRTTRRRNEDVSMSDMIHGKYYLFKRVLVVSFVAVLFACYCAVSIKANAFGFDFKMRYNEVKCVLHGTDPLLIWNGTVSSSEYVPFAFEHFFHDKGLNLVHSYPPWSYTYLMPLVLLPKRDAITVFAILEFFCSVLLFAGAFQIGFRRKCRHWDGCLYLVVVVLGVGEPMMRCLHVLNYGIIVAGAAWGMVVSLNRGYDRLAGLCWAIMMVKPQLAVLFFVPLLMGGKWRTIVTAVVICLVASLPPSLLCGRSPIDMILSILEYGRGYQTEVLRGISLVPSCVVQALQPSLTASGVLLLNAAIGLVICCVASWVLRNHDDWLFRMVPTSVICVMWMAPRVHDQVCLVFFYIVAVDVLLRLLDRFYIGEGVSHDVRKF